MAVVAGWQLIVGACCAVAFVVLARFFVLTEHGQKLDTVALTGNSIGRARIDELINTVLNAMSLVSVAIATAVLAFIALIRRRRGLALMVLLLIAGANATTQLLKQVIDRPNLGVDIERAAAGNSLPSGHTTVAASVAVALVLVLPPRTRAVGAVLAAGYAALAGVATLSAGWHRPSDAMAALLVVGGWTAAVSFILVLVQRREDFVRSGDAHPVVTVVLVLAGVALLGAAAVAVALTDQVRDLDPAELSRRRLFAAYAGGAAGIAGTAALLIGLLLLTVHRVVPQRGVRGDAAAPGVPATRPDAGGPAAPDDRTVRLPSREPRTVRPSDAEPPTVRLSDPEPPTVRLPEADGPRAP
jgi:membrane-associated phospholipid phosphatase